MLGAGLSCCKISTLFVQKCLNSSHASVKATYEDLLVGGDAGPKEAKLWIPILVLKHQAFKAPCSTARVGHFSSKLRRTAGC